MYQDKPEWIEHQRQRWMRPDAERWMRPDAERYLKPPPFDHKAFVAQRRAAAQEPAGADFSSPAFNPLDDPEVRRLLAEIKLDLELWKLQRKYRPDQPRDELGRWTDTGDGASPITIGDRTVDADVRIHPAVVLIDKEPRVTRRQIDPQLLLSMMTNVQTSFDATGAVGFVSGGRTDLPRGFLVTAGSFGVIMPSPTTGDLEAWLYVVPSDITAAIITTRQGDVRVTYSPNRAA